MQRSLTLNTVKTSEILPRCFQANYDVSGSINVCSTNGTSFTTYENFALNFFLTTAVAPASIGTTSLVLYATTSAGNVAVKITQQLEATVGGSTFVGSPNCAISADDVTATVTSPSSIGPTVGCSFVYSCENFCNGFNPTGFFIQVTTDSNENMQGISYNIGLLSQSLNIRKLTYNVPYFANTTFNTNTQINQFLGSQSQDLYTVNIAAFNSTLLGLGAFDALTVSYVDLVFSISALYVNGIRQSCGSAPTWDMYVNKGDIAISDSTGNRVNTAPSTGCYTATNSTGLCFSNDLETHIPACSAAGTYYISVAYPNSASVTFGYTIDVFFRATYPQELPTYQLLTSNNVVLSSVIGVEPSSVSAYAVQEQYYLIDIPKVNPTDDLFVTVFNVENGVVSVHVKQELGFDASCGIIKSYVCTTNAGGNHNINDYCKIKIPGCNFLSTVAYWVTITGIPNSGQQVVRYSVNAQVVTIESSSVTSLPSSSLVGGTLYTDINVVQEQAYNHYALNIAASSINHNSLLVVTVYPNHEQNAVVFNYNQGAYAGSYGVTATAPGNVDGPKDNCFSSLFVCATANKVSTQVNYLPSTPNTPSNVPQCVLSIPYCQLLDNQLHYFSVYAVDSSSTSLYYDASYPGPIINGELGYNRSVDYTITFALYNAPFPLNNAQTYNAGQFPSYSGQSLGLALNQISRQYQFTVPVSTVLEAYSEVVFLVEAVTLPSSGSTLTAYVQCGQQAGPCPCYTNDLTCGFASGSTSYKCGLSLPICDCPSNVFYLSVVVNSLPALPPVTYTVTAIGLSQPVLSSFNSSTVITSTLRPQDVDFFSNLGTSTFFPYIGNYVYGSELYRFRYNAGTSNQAIRVTVRFAEPIITLQQIILLTVGDQALSPINPFYPYGGDCVYECIAKTSALPSNGLQFRAEKVGDDYCTIVLEPCKAPSSDYFIRVSGFSTALTEGSSFDGVDFTLQVAVDDYTPIPLKLGSSTNGNLLTEQQDFYAISLSGLGANQWVRVSLYQDVGYPNDISFYYNFGSPAGSFEQNCYSREGQCHLVLSRGFCDFFFTPCELAGQTTLYVTAHASRTTLPITINDYHQIGDQALPYTIQAKTGGVISLDDQIPRTGKLLRREDAYYSFTIPTGFQDIFHLNLNNVEPNFPKGELRDVAAYIGSYAPGNTANCGCGTLVFTQTFDTLEFPCNADSYEGLYYIRVRAENSGADYDVDPITYTIRAWTQPMIHQTISLGYTFTNVSQPLDFDGWADFTINLGSGGLADNQYLFVEIADVTDESTITGNNGVEAWLNYNQIASPANSALHSPINPLFSTGAACSKHYLAIDNQVTSPAGTVMGQFLVYGCGTCFSSVHLTVHSVFDYPLPYQQRVTFLVRAYIQTAVTPTNFPQSSTFRSDALVSGGYTFTFADLNNPVVNANTTTGNTIQTIYLFELPSLTVQNNEALSVSVVSSSGLTVNIQEVGACTSFANVVACTPGSTYTIFGIVTSNSGASFQSVNGLQLNFVITQNNNYTQLTPNGAITDKNGQTYNDTLQPGQFRVIAYTWTTSSVVTLPDVTISVSGNVQYCFTSSPITNPGCQTCNTNTQEVLNSCCTNTLNTLYVNVYNPLGSGSSQTYTVSVGVTTFAQGYSALTLPAKGSTGNFANNNLYQFYSFSLTPQNMASDSVLNFRFNPNSVSDIQTVYFNKGGYAGTTSGGNGVSSSCVAESYSCNAGDVTCNVQLPFCFFGSEYGTYYLGIIGGNNPSNGTNYNLFVQTTTIITVGGSSVSGSVPDLATSNPQNLVHFKFSYTRILNELGLLQQNAGLIIKLSTNIVNNSLELYLRDSSSTANNNVLAGPSTAFSGVLPSSCLYESDFASWSCNATSTPSTGGTIQCITNFCTSNPLITNDEGYIYLSVQNVESINPITSTSFSLSVSTYSTPVLNTTSVFPITPIFSNNDVLSTTGCSTSGNTNGGCNFNQTTFNTNYAVFKVDLTGSASWGPYDYFTINVTSLSNSINILSWDSNVCEPSSSTSCNPGEFCYTSFSPCSTRSSLYAQGDNALDQSYNLYYFFGIQMSTLTSFHIEVHRVTPYTQVIPLNANVLSFEETFAFWDYRWVMLNFQVPQTHAWDFKVSVTTSCTDGAPLFVYANPFHYVAAGTCEELDGINGSPINAFSDLLPGCISGGNYYLSFTYDSTLILPTNVTAPEGRLHPQIRVTVQASIKAVNWLPLPLRCTEYVDVVNQPYKLTVDAENFGTQLSINIANCMSATCSLKVLTPNYEGDFNTAFFDEANALCQIASTSANNVLSCSATLNGGCTIPVNPCSFRPGTYYVIFTQSSAANSSISTSYDRKDIPVIPLTASNNYYGNVTTEFFGTYDWTQIYKVTTDGSNLGLEIQISFPDLSDFGSLVELYENCAFSEKTCNFQQQIHNMVTVTSYQWPVSWDQEIEENCITTGLTSFKCADNYPYTCYYRHDSCPLTEYYIQFQPSAAIGVPTRVDLAFVGGSTNSYLTTYALIEPSIPLCGTVWGYKNDLSNGAQVTIGNSFGHRNGDYYKLGRWADEIKYDYRYNYYNPYIQFYKVDTSKVSTAYATLQITAQAQVENTTFGLPTLYFGNSPPAATCNRCFQALTLSSTTATLTIDCGLGSPLWIAVEANTATAYVVDYWIQVNIIQKAVRPLSAPSLSGHTATTVVTPYSTETVFTVVDTAQTFAITGITTTGTLSRVSNGDVVQTGCATGCNNVYSSCPLSGPATYAIDVMPAAAVLCASSNSSSSSVTFQNIVSVAISTTVSYSFCSTPVTTHFYNLASSSYNNNLVTGFTFTLIDITASNSINVGFLCGSLPCTMPIALGEASSFTTTFSLSSCQTCNLFFSVSPSSSCGQCVAYSFRIDPVLRQGTLSGVTLAPPAWNGIYLNNYAHATTSTYEEFIVTAGSGGFVHVAVGNANSTIRVDLFQGAFESGCPIKTCTTGGNFLVGFDGYNQPQTVGESCFVYSPAVSGEVFVARATLVAEGNAPAFRIQAITSWTTISNSPITAQIIGNNRQYYTFSTSNVESIVLHLSMIDGPRVTVTLSDQIALALNPSSANLVTNFVRTMTCHYGECRIEIPTLAVHPGTTTFYVIVETIINPSDGTAIEKPTNYQISATVGTQNCVASSGLSLSYCAGVLNSGSSFWNWQYSNLRDQEASCFFNTIDCYCPIATVPCQTQLKRFACVETFRECDTNGFIAPTCRGECYQVETECGAFTCSSFTRTCGDARYLDSEPCSGTVSTLNNTSIQPILSPVPIIPTDPEVSPIVFVSSSVTPFVATGSNFPTPSPGTLPPTPSNTVTPFVITGSHFPTPSSPPSGASPSNTVTPFLVSGTNLPTSSPNPFFESNSPSVSPTHFSQSVTPTHFSQSVTPTHFSQSATPTHFSAASSIAAPAFFMVAIIAALFF